jgi:hypothetical protein
VAFSYQLRHSRFCLHRRGRRGRRKPPRFRERVSHTSQQRIGRCRRQAYCRRLQQCRIIGWYAAEKPIRRHSIRQHGRAAKVVGGTSGRLREGEHQEVRDGTASYRRQRCAGIITDSTGRVTQFPGQASGSFFCCRVTRVSSTDAMSADWHVASFRGNAPLRYFRIEADIEPDLSCGVLASPCADRCYPSFRWPPCTRRSGFQSKDRPRL